MLSAITNSWALLLGIAFLMLGNGLQSTVLSVRGSIEGFSTESIGAVMTCYFIGYLAGSFVTPKVLANVGHVRVFAALASLSSASALLHAVFIDPYTWGAMRLITGFCFAGLYIVAESWLNDMATNETRGQTLSTYLIVQMLGIIIAQFVLNLWDASGYALFVIISVLVSISFAPILLSVNAAPVHSTTKRMSIGDLYRASPLGAVGCFILGGIFAAQFGMGAVFATAKGLSLADLSIFVAMIYVGGLLAQYPLGYISDRMDRRLLISALTGAGTVALIVGMLFSGSSTVLLTMAFMMGAVSNPLYSLLIAYVNDYLEQDDMAAASSGLLFLNGIGAILGPLIVGWMMTNLGPDSYFAFIAALFALISAYAAYRMTQRAAPSVEDTNTYAAIAPQMTAVAHEVAQEYAQDQAGDEEDT